MSPRGLFLIILLAIVGVVANSSIFIVNETERAVLRRFGVIKSGDITPGLHFKVPLIETVSIYDGRVLTLDTPKKRYLTLEKKHVVVDSYVKWRIKDVTLYDTRTQGFERNARNLLTSRVDNGLRNQFGERSMHEVVSGERDLLMDEFTKELDKVSQTELGIEILDVRVKGIDLPPEVSSSVFSRMRSEREKEAREHRSKGKEQAEIIRADADRQKIVVESSAYRDAEQIRGEGDAIAANLYAEAYSKNPDFFEFVRSLKAYRESFGTEGNLMVVEPNSDFFRFMKDMSGK